MEKVGDTLKRVVKDPKFVSRLEELKYEILEDTGVQQFLSAHVNEVNKEIVDKGLGKLFEYINASHQCEKCANLEQCTNIMKGFEPKLVLSYGLIDVEYHKCQKKLVDDERREVSKMIESMYMAKDVMKARLQNIDFFSNGSRVEARVEVVRLAQNFLNAIDETGQLPKKGLYIHGPFGVGKSFILGALANELAERRIQTVIVYVPEFLREMKQSIQEQTLSEKIDYVKSAQVLMLDDFGAESISAWTRDEVLGTILQYRMSEQLPTFFSSNFGFDELEHHLTYSQRGEKEVVKAARIMERIRTISSPLKLDGENRR